VLRAVHLLLGRGRKVVEGTLVGVNLLTPCQNSISLLCCKQGLGHTNVRDCCVQPIFAAYMPLCRELLQSGSRAHECSWLSCPTRFCCIHNAACCLLPAACCLLQPNLWSFVALLVYASLLVGWLVLEFITVLVYGSTVRRAVTSCAGVSVRCFCTLRGAHYS